MNIYEDLSRKELFRHILEKGYGVQADSGALAIDTGTFKGRSPKDRYIVCDDITKDRVHWGAINQKLDPTYFDMLEQKMSEYMKDKDVYMRSVSVCADDAFSVGVKVTSEYPWQDLFVSNMFLPSNKKIDWEIWAFPGFAAGTEDGTRQENFTILNFTKRKILVGGSAYTGEIKKGMFSVLNFILPTEHDVFPMHCSANQGENGDVALFFGLSGTGKTTLSADPNRYLIGDDEHGWSDSSVFNFEGGCYAKCIDLSKEKEPFIYEAIKEGALLENVLFFPETATVDFSDGSKTENTRVSYPLSHIEKKIIPSIGKPPKNIFFLTCDAYGVLPPISKLSKEQAMQYFLLGYTAKVAGTEVGVKEPQATFSACFGEAFMPLHPKEYAELLRRKIDGVSVWLINTGWSGGSYGVGKRMSLSYTRTMVEKALSGELDTVEYETLLPFNLSVPKECPGVPSDILFPEKTWIDKKAYTDTAQKLMQMFEEIMKKYEI